MGHYLRRNHATGIPSSHLVLDTETVPESDPLEPTLHVNKLRLGVARHFRLESGKPTRPQEIVFRDRNTILNWILDRMSRKYPLWVWAHNAAFDLTAIGVWMLFESGELSLRYRPKEGETCRRTGRPRKPRPGLLVTEDPPTIVRCYRKDGATLWLVDTLNWFMCPLKELGDAVGLPKLDMPGEVASDADWEVYCRRDCEILEKTVVNLLSFVADADLGNFRATAASQSMAFFRHRCMETQIVMDDNIPAKEFERQAYYGGRREVYYNGSVVPRSAAGLERMAGGDPALPIVAKGPVYHLDLTGAYPSVMASNVYPTKRIGQVESISPDDLDRRMAAVGAVAHVQVSCGTGSWPVRRGDRTVYAMGDFDTFLCGPELIRAIRSCAVRRIYRAQLYSVDRIFGKFVHEGWHLRQQYTSQGNTLYARLCKLLLNSLHGKFGQRQHRWELRPNDVAPTMWGNYTQYWPETGRLECLRSVGGAVQIKLDGGECEESFPLIAAYATAYCREVMHQIRWAAGLREVLYEDADSIHVTQDGYDALRRQGWVAEGELGKLHVVRTAEVATYWGPKDYRLDDHRVTAGLSGRAIVDERGLWHQTNWHRLDSTLSGRPPDGPVCQDVTLQRPKATIAARVASDGWTEPILVREGRFIGMPDPVGGRPPTGFISNVRAGVAPCPDVEVR